MRTVEANGILFIMDVHWTRQRPGRRTDQDFAGAVFNKLDYARRIANERKLVPIFAGDVFERPTEADERLKGAFFKWRNQLWSPTAICTGNHDKRESKLSEYDTLNTLKESGLFDVADTTQLMYVVEVDGIRVAVGMTPYGEEIPKDVTPYLPDDVHTAVWVTHHDMAFEGHYPGSTELHEIKGCSLVVNGHMHNPAPTVTKGKTTWMNPGSLVRQRLEESGHEPAVWELDPRTGRMRKHVVPHEKDVFDWTGYNTKADKSASDGSAAQTGAAGAFVEMLAADQATDLPRTRDGSEIKERMSEFFERNRTPKPAQAILYRICDEVAEETVPN